jgi:hypothetical protein
MKLFTETYNSPLEGQGAFSKVFIEETQITHKRQENYFSVTFEMYVIGNDKRIILATNTLAFQGMNFEANNSNRTALAKIKNTEVLPEEIGSEKEFINVPLLELLSKNKGKLPKGATISDFGHPTFEDALNYFDGGTLEAPELTIENEFAKQWIINTLIMNGQNLVSQNFEFI